MTCFLKDVVETIEQPLHKACLLPELPPMIITIPTHLVITNYLVLELLMFLKTIWLKYSYWRLVWSPPVLGSAFVH